MSTGSSDELKLSSGPGPSIGGGGGRRAKIFSALGVPSHGIGLQSQAEASLATNLERVNISTTKEITTVKETLIPEDDEKEKEVVRKHGKNGKFFQCIFMQIS